MLYMGADGDYQLSWLERCSWDQTQLKTASVRGWDRALGCWICKLGCGVTLEAGSGASFWPKNDAGGGAESCACTLLSRRQALA